MTILTTNAANIINEPNHLPFVCGVQLSKYPWCICTPNNILKYLYYLIHGKPQKYKFDLGHNVLQPHNKITYQSNDKSMLICTFCGLHMEIIRKNVNIIM